jgi:hypothetical protein
MVKEGVERKMQPGRTLCHCLLVVVVEELLLLLETRQCLDLRPLVEPMQQLLPPVTLSMPQRQAAEWGQQQQ